MTTSGRPLRLPRAAAALRLPLWQRSQQRMREKYGFDMDSADALDRARALVGEKPDDAETALLLGSVLATRGENDLAEIYEGKITTWDDPQITALNPHMTLPPTKIVPVYRSDMSGDTFLFTSYLSTGSMSAPDAQKDASPGRVPSAPQVAAIRRKHRGVPATTHPGRHRVGSRR